LCKKNNVKTCAVVNVVESSIARDADLVLPIHCGPEVGVASTKAFLGQMLVLYLLCTKLSYEQKSINKKNYQKKIKDLLFLSKSAKNTLNIEDKIQTLGKDFANSKGSMFLGRGYSFPIALEGALKLKELAYVHAEGYPAGEMKHGPLALIEEGMPVVLLITNKSTDEIYSENIWEQIEVDAISDELIPFLTTIPLQKLAYYSALYKGYDIDKPRNLAKSVTVE
jgi:glucosamine--fructose-6-phosphate aminotransferase (isomerizing)